MTATATGPDLRMQCLEVWGGNIRTERFVRTPGLQVWVHSQPQRGADSGGDVYYVSSCASGRITRLLLADVSGHGEGVANVSSTLRDLMRQNINVIDQSRFVRKMNEEFSQNSELEEFATALVCTFFSPTRTLQFCNAGHPLPLLYRSEEKVWVYAQELAEAEAADGLADTPLGAIDEAAYSRYEIKLAEGDMFLCVSDAFTESFDDNGQMLGTAGLLELVRSLDCSDPSTIIPQMIDRIAAKQASNLTSDDASAILFRADGSSPSLASDLAAPLRLLRPVRDKTKTVTKTS